MTAAPQVKGVAAKSRGAIVTINDPFGERQANGTRWARRDRRQSRPPARPDGGPAHAATSAATRISRRCFARRSGSRGHHESKPNSSRRTIVRNRTNRRMATAAMSELPSRSPTNHRWRTTTSTDQSTKPGPARRMASPPWQSQPRRGSTNGPKPRNAFRSPPTRHRHEDPTAHWDRLRRDAPPATGVATRAAPTQPRLEPPPPAGRPGLPPPPPPWQGLPPWMPPPKNCRRAFRLATPPPRLRGCQPDRVTLESRSIRISGSDHHTRGNQLTMIAAGIPVAASLSTKPDAQPCPDAPASGWRQPCTNSPARRINPGISRKEREHKELFEQIRTPIVGDFRIAVLSIKGGVGKTTTTLGLGSALAMVRTDRVIAVDANPDRGTLAERVSIRRRRPPCEIY